jgi:hypothetical protein
MQVLSLEQKTLWNGLALWISDENFAQVFQALCIVPRLEMGFGQAEQDSRNKLIRWMHALDAVHLMSLTVHKDEKRCRVDLVPGSQGRLIMGNA